MRGLIRQETKVLDHTFQAISVYSNKWLPPKPTLLYMYDIIAKSQMLSEKKKPWVLIPSGRWRVLWGYALLTVSTADVMRCVWSLTFCQAPYLNIDLYALQAVFAFDILLNFCTAKPSGGGTLELRPEWIAYRYVNPSVGGAFLVDLIAVLPLEIWLTPCWPDNPNAPSCLVSSPSTPYLQLLSWQWLHILRWYTHWRRCDDWRSVTSTANDGLLQTIKLCFLVVVVAHVSGCLLYWATFFSSGEFGPVCDYQTLQALPWANVSGLVERHNDVDPFNRLLIDADTGLLEVPADDDAAADLALAGYNQLYFFWVFGAFTMLLGDAFAAKNTAARLTSLLMLFLGQVVFALVFTQVLLLVERSTASRSQYAARMAQINETMSWKGLDSETRRRVKCVYEYLWLVHGAAANEEGAAMNWLSELPSSLRVDIKDKLHGAALRACPLFEEFDDLVVVTLAQQLVPQICMPGEPIIREGMVGSCMYFIMRGQVAVYTGWMTEAQRAIVTLNRGSFFGEIAITKSEGVERKATCTSRTLLMLEKLSREALEMVSEGFPDIIQTITRISNDRRRELGEHLRTVEDIANEARTQGKVNLFVSKLKARAQTTRRLNMMGTMPLNDDHLNKVVKAPAGERGRGARRESALTYSAKGSNGKKAGGNGASHHSYDAPSSEHEPQVSGGAGGGDAGSSAAESAAIRSMLKKVLKAQEQLTKQMGELEGKVDAIGEAVAI